MCVVRTGSVQLSASSAINSTASLAWHRFCIANSGAQPNKYTSSFFIDGALVATITCSLTGSLPVIYGLQHNEKATVQVTGSAFAVKLDYIEFEGAMTR
jgi:hypothetical protein